MLPSIAAFLVFYGLCFGLQNKVSFLHGKTDFTDALLACTYCTGFHCGWVAWLMFWGTTGSLPAEGWHNAASVAIWCFASAAWCYGIDALVKYLEENS